MESMVSGVLLLRCFLALAALGSACEPSDMQCMADDSFTADLSSMLQTNTLSTVQNEILKSEAATSDPVAIVGAGRNPDMEEVLNPVVVLGESRRMWNRTREENIIVMYNGFVHTSWKTHVVSAVFSWAIYVMLALLIWSVCYPAKPFPVAEPADIEDPKVTLESGHFACLRSPEICWCACCCPGLRWADTMYMAGLTSIVTGLTFVFCCSLLNCFTYFGNAIVGPFTLLLALYYRHKLREAIGLSYWTAGSCCIDCLYLLFCPWCAIAQEARTVKHLHQKGGAQQQS